MRPQQYDSLTHDPLHGYIPFTSRAEGDECCERDIIDHPWVQRLRHIRQLQTAWWVYPTAEHTRFQHVVGVMHLASRAVAALYDSLCESCPDVPSRGLVESLMRMAGLLHDVGHGPFGHFFDEHFLRRFGATHEHIGAVVIEQELGELLSRIRRNPYSQLESHEQLDPADIAWLIVRPTGEADERPQWLHFLRALLSGIYTIDNLDFVMRDAYMSGYSQQAYDLDRLLHYSFFSERGLTIHDRGMDALTRFLSVKAELFRTIYFHRTVRAIDLTLADLFAASGDAIFPGDPREHLEEYLEFTEDSLLVDVRRWRHSDDVALRALGQRWTSLLNRRLDWRMVCQRGIVFSESKPESSSIFHDSDYVAQRIRELLPPELSELEFRVDIARHIYRPHTRGPSDGQNFLYDSAHDLVRPLSANQLFQQLPVSHRICRIYAHDRQHSAALATALDQLIGGVGPDDLTNM